MAYEEKPKDGADAKKKGKDGDEVAKGPIVIMGMGLPLFLLCVLNLVGTAGAAGYIYYVKLIYHPPLMTEQKVSQKIIDANEKQQKLALADQEKNFILTLPKMNINLRGKVGGSRSHFATVTVALKCSNDECMEDLKMMSVKASDLIQSLIGSRSHRELSVSSASFRLKHEITKIANSLVFRGTVTDTFFSNYLIQ